jgi:hypothetical protein
MEIVMKNLIMAVLTIFSFSAFGEEMTCKQLQSDSNISTEQLAQRGCCSWHGGVCGCSAGVVQCCDGSGSPSCRCHATDLIEPKAVESDTPKS